MLSFILGVFVGSTLAVFGMCMLAVARENRHMSELGKFERACQRFAASAERAQRERDEARKKTFEKN